MPTPTQTQAWRRLVAHRERLAQFDMRTAFADDGARATRLTREFEAAGAFLHLDFSRHRIDDAALAEFLPAAEIGLMRGITKRSDKKDDGQP